MKTFHLVALMALPIASSSLALDTANEVFMLRQQIQQRTAEPVIVNQSNIDLELMDANDRQAVKDDLAPFFRYKDEFERLYPYKKPKEPKYSSNPDDDLRNIALGNDYDYRLARWKLRMKAREEEQLKAHPASTPIQPIVNKPPITDADKGIAFNAEVEKSRQKVIEFFPVANQEGHPIHAKAAEMWKDLEKQNSPLIHEADAPFIVYSLVAAQMGIRPVK